MLPIPTKHPSDAPPHQRGGAWGILIAMLLGLILGACTLPVAPASRETPTPFSAGSTPAPLPPAPTNSPTLPRSTLTPTLGTLRMLATPTITALTRTQQLAIFDTIWETVNQNYVYQDFRGVNWAATGQTYRNHIAEGVSSAEFYQLMKEMIALLGDDHSRFNTPQEAAMDAALYSGEAEYGGIGIMIRQTVRGMVVVRLATGAPAEQAGLQLYDVIVGADDVIFDPQQFDVVDYGASIRGRIGTTVQLHVERDGVRLTIPVVRNVIPNDAFPEAIVQATANPKIAHLIIDSFNRDHLDDLVRDAFVHYQRTHEIPTGIVIDIRENYGGNIQSMLDVMALFCDGGTIGYQQDRTTRYPLNVARNQTLPDYENATLIILTSGETASAAEMFAAGMRSIIDVPIIGETTAGNSENLYPYTLSDGSVLWLAELLFIQTDETYIDDIGITPDIILTQDWDEMSNGQDSMLAEALDILAPSSAQ